ncbi:ammonium transporter [Gardnerella swidsinskii]|uniref:ammonium transporter n=1 Tax=Gardnerella TaxID=2701 RepID=UPI000C99C428|nr:ammonium transporter [Gardnerella swidsinskii]NSX39904.1 ammonium transporter [Gardnerella vaginalis]RIY26903.1 ammonia transporter [Bifidobacteriaceae bacterium WP021]RIY29083.1 ammonia transporter [Bifidobacteriaceae bacterium NR016]MDK7092625.1 ammonium transporter [Gardnerella swidsinskii]MDK8691832.1 ammonium transporter [Gardnerella swidsinskii]
MTTMDPQWALLAGALVFIITPGIALFYGGRERATSMVNMMMLSAGAIAVTTLVWTLWGWSLAFAGKDMAGGVIGDPLSGLLFRDSMVADHGVFTSMDANSGLSGGIPAAFRLACAVVAVALITGALAGRVRYAIWLIFVAVWITLVFAPLAHMVCGGGLLSPNGAISQALGISVHDFAGGSILHIAAAVSAFAIVMIIGGHAHFPLKRFVLHIKNVAHTSGNANSGATNSRNSKSRLSRALWADVEHAKNAASETVVSPVATVTEVAAESTATQSAVENGVAARHPHNVPFVMLGVFLIWFGWLGLMIGSSAGVPGVAGYAWVSSTITASASMLAWGVTERLHSGCFTALGAASGVMAGLAASAAAADVIAPLWALVLGVLSGVITSLVTHSRTFVRYDGALHVVSVNGVAALIGVLAVGLFADGSGLLAVGDWHQLVAQLCLIGITVLYAGAVTAVLAFVLEKLFGWRISEAKERKGVDLVDQGERAYDFSSIAQSHDGAVVAVADDDANKTQMAVLTSVDIDMGENEVEQSDFMVNQSEANPEQGDSEVDSKSEVEQKESSSEEEFETVKKDESSQKNKKTEKRNNSAKE